MIISYKFFICLIASALIYWAIPKQKFRSIFLFFVSLIYIGLHDIYAVIIILCLTTFSYLFAYLISTKPNKSLYHKLSIIGILLVLIIFKYLGFLTNTLNQMAEFLRLLPQFHIESLLLPLGISYLTFKLISYLTDVHWEIIERGSFINLLCYTSLFTIYVAGPIERFERFEPQISQQISFKSKMLEYGFQRILIGLFKKVVIADWIGYFINPIWDNMSEYSVQMRLIALFGFTMQAYMDFSGYSDIAIGSSRIFGLKIMENFNWPYIKPNISEFWRSWHISLIDWLRDYLYTPMVFRLRNWGRPAMVLAFIVVFTLSGLWHGANWNYIIWGFLHGLALSIYLFKTDLKKKLKINIPVWISYAMGMVSTFCFVSFTNIFFRAKSLSDALLFIKDAFNFL